MRVLALTLSILVALPAAAADLVNAGATGGGTTTMWDPGTAVTVLPLLSSAAAKAQPKKARVLQGRKSVALQFQAADGACCATFDPTDPVTTTTGCAHGLRLDPDNRTLARGYSDLFPVKLACTKQMTSSSGTGVAVDQAK